MHFVSAFRQAPERAIATLRRFPVVLLAGAFLAGVIIAEPEDAAGERLVMTALLSIIVAFDLSLIRERLALPQLAGQLGVLALASAIVGGLHLSVDVIMRETVRPITQWVAPHAMVAVDEPIRFAAIGLALHALAAVIPFAGRRSLTAFWDYNRTLFLRILASALFSGVLYAGLMVALWALDELLGVEIGGETPEHLFAVMAGVVNTWFFLAGVPPAWRSDETESEAREAAVYPRGLKVFVQFVLLPLAVIYLVILYLYVGRIIIEWELPQGQVSYLIFGYAVVGMLAYLLIHPLREEEGNHWVRTFAHGFFLAMAPLLVVLAVALLRRIADYGLTEPRYYGLALALWLAIVVAYFLTRRDDIRFIPATLGVLALLTTFGPWGATSVAVRSQIAQLQAITERPRPYGEEDANSVRSIASFLDERGRLEEGAALVSRRPDTISAASELVAALGVDPSWLGNTEQGLHHSFERQASIDVRGFSDMVTLQGTFDTLAATSPALGPIVLRWRAPGTLTIVAAGASLDMRLDSLAEALPEDDRRGSSPTPILEAHGAALRARLLLHNLRGAHQSGSTAMVHDFNATLLLGRSPETDSR